MYNYREVQIMQAQIYRNRQAQRALHRLRNKRVTAIYSLRNACNQASSLLPIEVRHIDTLEAIMS
jgi:hypothetical protein